MVGGVGNLDEASLFSASEQLGCHVCMLWTCIQHLQVFLFFTAQLFGIYPCMHSAKGSQKVHRPMVQEDKVGWLDSSEILNVCFNKLLLNLRLLWDDVIDWC